MQFEGEDLSLGLKTYLDSNNAFTCCGSDRRGIKKSSKTNLASHIVL